MAERTSQTTSRRLNDCGGYFDRIQRAETDGEKIELAAHWLLQAFDDYYIESRGIPDLAKSAFERRDPGESLALSKRRLSIYSESIHTLGLSIVGAFPQLGESEQHWRKVEETYSPWIEGRYEVDLAFSFVNSVRRKIYRDEWTPVEYAFIEMKGTASVLSEKIYRSFPGGAQLSPETTAEILQIPNFTKPYQDIAEDAFLVAERVNDDLGLVKPKDDAIETIQMIDAGFYRNRGAYIVGRIVLSGSVTVPFVIALLNDDQGIYVDAVLTTEADTHNIFSSTLANFHVTSPYYHELAAFLNRFMPNRPLGLHYSTIGFNHVGKVAVIDELKDELAVHNEAFEAAVGFPGTVAIAFSAPSSAYTLKVIRDKPTSQYKWGEFAGLESVLDKYRRIHETNRTGSMLDNIIYYNLRLDRAWFDAPLLEELLNEAGGSVSAIGDFLVFKHLIVQPKMIPLPVFLEGASQGDAEKAVVSLGHCIKNNAAANIFNRDLDGRNYGVSKFLKVYLFDYDALEVFTEVKIRTNRDRIDGEEDIPGWFFEDGVVFLPEEVEMGLRIQNAALTRHFRDVHGDLLTTEYWEAVQRDLLDGLVPSISVYPDERRLLRQISRLGTYY
ncbi:MAG: bifunctional isocitrate dehydrogenase kinase/phosphatase [Proteobacteria bacterium]|nr:bifunctional isocitrate dehydrogenase kinase/phosphatase [Pseudomonadota bacterium]